MEVEGELFRGTEVTNRKEKKYEYNRKYVQCTIHVCMKKYM